MMGIAVGTSKAQLHRARRLLREALRTMTCDDGARRLDDYVDGELASAEFQEVELHLALLRRPAARRSGALRALLARAAALPREVAPDARPLAGHRRGRIRGATRAGFPGRPAAWGGGLAAAAALVLVVLAARRSPPRRTRPRAAAEPPATRRCAHGEPASRPARGRGRLRAGHAAAAGRPRERAATALARRRWRASRRTWP